MSVREYVLLLRWAESGLNEFIINNHQIIGMIRIWILFIASTRVCVNMYCSYGGRRVDLIERLNCTAALGPTSLFGELKRNLELLKLDVKDAPKHQFCRVSFDIPPFPFENSVEHFSNLQGHM